MSRSIFKIVSFCLVFAHLVGCRQEIQEVSRDDAIRYYLNQRNYEQAIGLLKEKLILNPDDDGAKIQLASAYSGSVGINTIDCFDVLKPKLFDQPLASKALSLRQSGLTGLTGDTVFNMDEKSTSREQRQQDAIKTIEKELLRFATQASDALDIAFRLPHTPLADRERIMLSMNLLADIKAGSEHYLTAQLYQGILAMIQFVNYLRDAVPPRMNASPERVTKWYQSLYCQLDLAILMPNLSQSINFLTVAFASLTNAGRSSENPVYTNLVESTTALTTMNRIYISNLDLFEFADWSARATKGRFCESVD